MDYDSVLSHIETSDLTGVEYRTARRLLDRASNQWTVLLSREEACDVCGVSDWGAARKSLKRLEEKGVIAVHTNNLAYVRLFDRAPDASTRAETARQRAETTREDLTEPRQNCAPARRNGANRVKTARQRAVLDGLPRDQGSPRDWEGGDLPSLPSPIVLEGGAGETAESASGEAASAPKRRGTPVDPADAVRSVGLLTDPEVGLSDHVAVQVAEKYTWEEVRRAVFRFVRDRRDGKANGPGCLPHRLAKPERFPSTISGEDLESDLWQRHHTPEECYQEIRRKWIPDEYADIILG